MSRTLLGATMRTAVVLAVVGLVGLGGIGAGSAARSVASAKPCPKGSVAAKIDGKRACLKPGQTCKRSLDKQYHRYGFHCHTGRLARATKPKPSDVFSRKVDVGGFRLAISCRGTGSPTVILESGGGESAEAWFLMERIVAKTTRVCSYDRAGLGVSDPRSPPGPVPAARGRRGAASPARRGRHLAAVRPRRLVARWLLQSAVREALSRRSGRSRRRRRNADRSSGRAIMAQPAGPPYRSISSAGRVYPDSYLPGGRRRGARGRAGSGSAANRRADAWTIRRNTRRLRGAVEDLAETRRPAVDVVDPPSR